MVADVAGNVAAALAEPTMGDAIQTNTQQQMAVATFTTPGLVVTITEAPTVATPTVPGMAAVDVLTITVRLFWKYFCNIFLEGERFSNRK